jgi:hypothetical protein
LAVFRRRTPPPGPFKHYSAYRPFVREDFEECCAYCLLHEILAAGPESFELDHFRPKSLPGFSRQINDFYNLYYTCRPCNHAKGSTWPDLALEDAGFGFLDLCAETFSAHFQEEPDGSWVPLSPRAEYTLEKLRLNRSHLVRIRRYLREIAKERGLEPMSWDVPARDRIQALLAP